MSWELVDSRDSSSAVERKRRKSEASGGNILGHLIRPFGSSDLVEEGGDEETLDTPGNEGLEALISR